MLLGTNKAQKPVSRVSSYCKTKCVYVSESEEGERASTCMNAFKSFNKLNKLFGPSL